MATKKKPAAKKSPAKKPASGAKKPVTDGPSIAVKTLGTLPALTGKLRLAYRASFSDEQCEAWGRQTDAREVIREAGKWVQTLVRALNDDSRAPYTRRRLAYLCELLVLLEDEVARTSDTSEATLKATRSAVLSVAVNARRELARLLRAVAGGRTKIIEAVAAAAPAHEDSPSDVQDSLTATIDLAVKLRRDELLEALADDVGLTEAKLNSAYAALEALTGAAEVALNPATYEGDAPSVNVIEGRVVRELRLAQQLFNEARDAGVSLPVLAAGPAVLAVFRSDASA